ncbi:MAG: tetratricopeptide repeat protein [Spirochaetales bacterium]|nr:tetratricopeptide repeat protein [Spirochaetales bacterium]
MSGELDNIIYIAVSEELERTIGDFQVDPEIMLPVEVTGGTDTWDIQDLSWEQIIAAMLKILAYEPGHDDAEYYREFVLTVRPQIIDELTQTAVLKARNTDYDIAKEIFLALIGLQPGDQRPLINLALLYEERANAAEQSGDEEASRSDAERAYHVYREIMEADDILPEAHLNAGHFFLKERDYSRARNHLQAYLTSGDDAEKKKEAARIVHEIDSHNLLDTLFKEAYDFIRMGREEDGIERIRKFLDSYPDVWNGWFLLGWGLRRLRRFDEAGAAFDRALETGPRQTDTLNELAICAMELNALGKARSLLVEALSQEPENTKIISNLGIVALKSNDSEEAEAYFRAVLEIAPDDQVAQTYLGGLAQT